MIRYLAFLALAAASAHAQERLVERAPTPFVEAGKPVTLEVVIYKPAGSGPFPTLVMNHGSTGGGNKPELFTRTWTNGTLSSFFNERGWLVAFPQRRGRGASDGLYDEGFESNRSRYTCQPQLSLPGVERAMADVDAAVAYIRARADVDAKRMLIGGQSRGGILSIAYAGTRPQAPFGGVINFVGGWLGEGCWTAGAVNGGTFKRGAAFPGPTLWLYAEKDPFYSVAHSRGSFDAFTEAGGKGTFMSYTLEDGKSGHSLIGYPQLWGKAVDGFLEQLKRREQ